MHMVRYTFQTLHFQLKFLPRCGHFLCYIVNFLSPTHCLMLKLSSHNCPPGIMHTYYTIIVIWGQVRNVTQMNIEKMCQSYRREQVKSVWYSNAYLWERSLLKNKKNACPLKKKNLMLSIYIYSMSVEVSLCVIWQFMTGAGSSCVNNGCSHHQDWVCHCSITDGLSALEPRTHFSCSSLRLC
jgi:hypothetical protein